MSFGDSTFHQHNLFLRSMPRIGAVNQAALSANRIQICFVFTEVKLT